MDELTLMRAFRAERVKHNPTARAEAWRALEARFAATSPTAAAAPRAPRRRLLFRRRQLFAFAAAMALAAVITGVLVLSSGPTAQPAAAEVLRQTAAVAAAAGGATPVPDPGQFLYERTKSRDLQEWVPGVYTASYGGVIPGPHSTWNPKDAFAAFVSWQRSELSRSRWVMEPLRFLTREEKSRWQKAGSPLPGPFGGEGERRGFPGGHVIEARRGVLDVETVSGHGFRDFSMLPREPKALRQAIERRQHTKPVDTGQTIAELWEILDKPNGTPALRAAVFGALAELPGIELNREAKDLVGRPGYALSYEKPNASHSDYQLPGIRVEYIFDPDTSAILGKREVVADPQKLPWAKAPPAGAVTREVAYLESGIVDSARERPHGRNRGPVATTDPASP
jgi:hypothetical protein